MLTNNNRPYIGDSNNSAVGVILESDHPLAYDETGEVPPFEDSSDAKTLEGHSADYFAVADHNHDTVYSKLDHTHTTEQIDGLDTALAGKAASSHTHTQAQITGLTTALNGKAASSHTHAASAISAGTFGGNVVARSGGAVGTKMMRNIYAGTSDIGAGASLTTGDIYLVYE